MKKVIWGTIAAALLVTASIYVIAQKTHKDGHRFGPGRGHRGGVGMALRGLDLTEGQKAQVKEIMESSRTTVEPLRQQMRDIHDKIRILGTDGKFDQAKVETLAAEQGNITAKMIVEKEKGKAHVFAILTDEQKTKAETMRKRFDDQFKARNGMHDKPAGFEF